MYPAIDGFWYAHLEHLEQLQKPSLIEIYIRLQSCKRPDLSKENRSVVCSESCRCMQGGMQ